MGQGGGLVLVPGGNALQWGLRGANRSHPNQDKHKAQYCSNKKNDKIEKAIVRIERRDREGMVRLALVLAVELFEHAGVGSQAARRQELSREPSEHLLLQALSL